MKYKIITKSDIPVIIRKPSKLALKGINQLSNNQLEKQTIIQRLEQIYNLRPSRDLSVAINLLSRMYDRKWEIAAGVDRLPFDVYVSELYLEQEKRVEPLLTVNELENYYKNLIKIHEGQGLSSEFKNHSLSNKKRVTKDWIYSRNWGGFWSFRVKIDGKGENKRKELAKEGKIKESQLYRTDTIVCIYRMNQNPKLLQLAVIGRHDDMYIDVNPSRLAYQMYINKKEK